MPLVDAKILTVDDNGGSADHQTIQAAIDEAESNDTILVRNGVYYENVIVNKTLAILGEKSFSTIVDGEGSGLCFAISSNHTRIENFSVTNANLGILLDKVSNCTLENILCVDMESMGILLDYSSNNSFHNISTYLCKTGLQLYYSSNNRISEARSYNNTNYNLYLYSARNNSLNHCYLSNSTIGLIGVYSDNNLFDGLISSDCNYYGIYFSSSSNNSIMNASFSENEQYDIFFDYASINEAVNLSHLNLSLLLQRESKLYIYCFLCLEIISEHNGVGSADVLLSINGTRFYQTQGYGGNDSRTNNDGELHFMKALYAIVTEKRSYFFEGQFQVKKNNWSFSKVENLSNSHKILVENKAPLIREVLLFPLDGDQKTEFNFTINCTDSTLQYVYLKVDNKTFSLNIHGNSIYTTTLRFAPGEHIYSVIAFDGLDKNETNPQVFFVNDTIPPEIIKHLKIEDYQNGKLLLSWIESEDDAFSYYNIYISQYNFSSVKDMKHYAQVFERQNTSYLLKGLTTNISYYLAVTAADTNKNENTTVNTVRGISTQAIDPVFDVIIDKFNVSPKEAKVGENITIFFSIQNKGNMNIEDLSIIVFLNEIKVFNYTYQNIFINKNISESFPLTIERIGIFNLSLEVLFHNKTKIMLEQIVVKTNEETSNAPEEGKSEIIIFLVIGLVVVISAVSFFFSFLEKEKRKKIEKEFSLNSKSDIEESVEAGDVKRSTNSLSQGEVKEVNDSTKSVTQDD